MERFYETEGYEAGSNVLRMVGYFSLVGLLRVHTLVGDYGGALAALAPIHPFQRTHLFTPKIAGASHPVRRGIVSCLQKTRRRLSPQAVPNHCSTTPWARGLNLAQHVCTAECLVFHPQSEDTHRLQKFQPRQACAGRSCDASG